MIELRSGKQLVYYGGADAMTQAQQAVSWWLAGGIDPGIVGAAYGFKGATSKVDALINRNQPGTDDAIESAVAAWDAINGFKFRTDGYLLAGALTPGAATSIFCRFASVKVNDVGALFGSQNGSGKYYFVLPNYLGNVYWVYGDGIKTVAPGMVSGTMCISGGNGYRDGSVDYTGIGTWSGVNPYTINIGAYSLAGANGTQKLWGDIYYLSIYNAGLTPAQISALHTATL